jgi:hypothetical protein
MLNPPKSWDKASEEELNNLVYPAQEVSVDVAAKRVLWVKPQPDYHPLFSNLDG